MPSSIGTPASAGWDAVPPRDEWPVGAIAGIGCPRCHVPYSLSRTAIRHENGAHVCVRCARDLGIPLVAGATAMPEAP
ncbi:hypothetical protein GCM10020367_56820 [Streptomyces sannanensis]|uniref:C2H2-type domain-containing protein n=1 Tax=Streptomyces sannanensis TaxID=285536 RepID=A0ABP6SJ38_9ACTN